MYNVGFTCKRVRRSRFGAACAQAQGVTKAIDWCKRLLGDGQPLLDPIFKTPKACTLLFYRNDRSRSIEMTVFKAAA